MTNKSHTSRQSKSLPRKRARRGYVYIAVLFTTLIVMATVTAALSISTSRLRGEIDRDSQGEALRFAEAEMHRLAALMQSSSSWRTDHINGVFTAWRSFTVNGVNATGNSQVRFRLVDPDGDLNDDHRDSVELTVHARAGNSQTALSIELEPDPQPLSLLNYSVTAADDIQLESATLSCELPVQVFDDCKTNTWGILTTPRIEITGYVQPTFRGDQSTAAITLPALSVVDAYVDQGTEISAASIPAGGAGLLIQDIVLSPASNPFGSVDAGGVYWIDANGAAVEIANSRLDATVAIKNASLVRITGGVTWSFPQNAEVILATDAAIEFTGMEKTLDEATRGINFNPATTPYRSMSNANATDQYPTEFRGVIHTIGDIRIFNSGNPVLSFIGSIICSDFEIEGYVTIRELSEIAANPLVGLSDYTPMRFVRGSLRRIPSP